MPLWTFQAWVVMAAYGQLPNIGYAARRRSLKSILKQEWWQWLQFDFSFFLSLCSAWLQKHSFLLKHWYLQTCLELEPIWRLREYAVAVKPYKQLGLARVEAQSWRWIFPQYICIHFRKKVQPYVPSTPVLYLGMDDDNGKKDDNNNNNNHDNDNNNR